MTIIVQKFGGTSVGTIERIEYVADKIIAAKKQGHQLVVVLSAMGGETDRLLGMARSIAPKPNPRELDVLLATGEQVSIALLSMALLQRGCEARSYTGSQVPILTDGVSTRARILEVAVANIRKDLDLGRVVVIAGFQGVDAEGNITTLGRGGSDTSAVAIAAALAAEECQIFTDVAGVYTTDPRIVPAARLIPRLTFEEMLELAALGAKVLQTRAVEIAGRFGVPLRVLSTFKDGAGTLIALEDKTVEQPVVSGIAFSRNEALLSVIGLADKPGVAAQVIGAINAAGIEVDMIIQNTGSDGKSTDLTLTVAKSEFAHTKEVLQGVATELGAREIASNNKIAKISVIGAGMRSHSKVASMMFETLGQEGINIKMISTSEIKVSVIVDEKYLELGVRALHSAFGLELEPEEHT